MITFGSTELVRTGDGGNVYLKQGTCLSTDEKPTGNVENGSRLIEMDTGKIYFYDAENGIWREFT